MLSHAQILQLIATRIATKLVAAWIRLTALAVQTLTFAAKQEMIIGAVRQIQNVEQERTSV